MRPMSVIRLCTSWATKEENVEGIPARYVICEKLNKALQVRQIW